MGPEPDPGPLAALASYLERNPSDREQPASWLGLTLWALELVAGKPTREQVEGALEALEREPALAGAVA